MRKRKLKIIAVLTAALLYAFMISAYAYSLNNGSVHGLPEKLVVLDDEGNSVSENGSYYFSVTDMKPKITYTKNIQIMNLRDDKSYNIYFGAESVSSKGEIDLENECECVIMLDGEEVYRGKVSGKGNPDMQKAPLDLGEYAPNEYRHMQVNVTWDGTSAGNFIDNGERVVTASGTEITRNKSGETFISGETEFKWIFTAEVKEEDTSSTSSGSSVGEYLRDKYGMTLTKNAVTGTTLAVRDGRTDSIYERMTVLSGDYDYIIFDGGINDNSAKSNNDPTPKAPTGEVTGSFDPEAQDDSIDVSTTVGALEAICRFLVLNYPDAKKLFVISHELTLPTGLLRNST